MKTIVALIVLACVFQIGKAEGTNSSNIGSREICLSSYLKYIEILKKTYQQSLTKLNAQQQERFLDINVVYIVQKCQSLELKQQHIQNFLETLSKQSSESLNVYLMGDQKIDTQKVESLDQGQKLIWQEIQNVKAEIKAADGIILFGYNLKKLPKSAKYYYLAVYTLIAIGALVYGLKDMESKRQSTKRE